MTSRSWSPSSGGDQQLLHQGLMAALALQPVQQLQGFRAATLQCSRRLRASWSARSAATLWWPRTAWCPADTCFAGNASRSGSRKSAPVLPAGAVLPSVCMLRPERQKNTNQSDSESV